MKDEIGTHLIALSAHSENELNSKLKELSSYLKDCHAANIPLIDVCSSINISPLTIKHAHRAVAIGTTYEEIISKIDSGELIRGVAAKNPPKICFLYSGYGVLYPKMSYELYQTSPLFRHYVDLVEEEVEQCCEKYDKDYKSFQEIVYAENHLLDSQSGSMHANMRLGIILQKVWEYWGILPDMVLGSSLGEYAAACGAGFHRYHDSISQFTQSIFRIEEIVDKGGMFVLMLSKEAVDQLIADFHKVSFSRLFIIYIFFLKEYTSNEFCLSTRI